MDAVVVGLGRIGSKFGRDPLRKGIVTHASAWAAHPATDLVAGVDPDPGARQAFEEDHQVPAYASWQDLLEHHNPAFASVCVPPERHLETVVEVLTGGGVQRVICEKPCCPDLHSAEQLLKAVGTDPLRVGVNYTRQYDGLHRRLLPDLAPIRSGNGYYTAGLLNTASHWIASLLGTGVSIARVSARPAIDGQDPTPSMVFELVEGGTVSLHGLDVRNYLAYEMDLLTESARIQLQRSGTVGRRFVRMPSRQFSGYFELAESSEGLPAGLDDPMLAVIDDAVASVAENRAMLCSLMDAIAVHQVLAAAQTSLATGQPAQVC